jgi:hypothetical protein
LDALLLSAAAHFDRAEEFNAVMLGFLKDL